MTSQLCGHQTRSTECTAQPGSRKFSPRASMLPVKHCRAAPHCLLRKPSATSPASEGGVLTGRQVEGGLRGGKGGPAGGCAAVQGRQCQIGRERLQMGDWIACGPCLDSPHAACATDALQLVLLTSELLREGWCQAALSRADQKAADGKHACGFSCGKNLSVWGRF